MHLAQILGRVLIPLIVKMHIECNIISCLTHALTVLIPIDRSLEFFKGRLRVRAITYRSLGYRAIDVKWPHVKLLQHDALEHCLLGRCG